MKENRVDNGNLISPTPIRPVRKRGWGETACEDAAYETPIVFSRRKRRVVDGPGDGEGVRADTSLDAWLDFSARKSTPRTVNPVSSSPSYARRLTPSLVGKNPFAVSAGHHPVWRSEAVRPGQTGHTGPTGATGRTCDPGPRMATPGNVAAIPKTALGPPGFSNLGNSCYLASITQCLLGANAFVQEIVRLVDMGNGGPVTRALFDVIKASRQRNGLPMHLEKLKTTLASSEHGALFVGHQQQDAHEAFIKLLESIKNENGKAYRCPFSHTVLVEIMCEACGHTAKVEECGHLNVTIRADGTGGGVQNTLRKTAEKITKICDRCKGENHLRKSLISRLPQVLVVQLTRFEFKSGFMSKLSDDFAAEKTVMVTSNGSKRLELCGMVNHHGKFGHCGHYDALVRRPGETGTDAWFQISDALVTVTSEADVMKPSKTSYLLFYELV